MTDRWGCPPWRIVGIAASSPPPDSCDVAILGAGLTGLAAAIALARRGLRVAVLEARRVGAGASGRTGGIVLEGTATGPLPGVEDCVPGFEARVRELGIDCGLSLVGCREIAHRKPTGRETLRWRDEGRDLVDVGLVRGGTVDPGALLEGLARAALREGATLHEGVRVVALEAGRPCRVGLVDGELRAEAVLVAVNAYTATLLPELRASVRTAVALAMSTAPVAEEARAACGLADCVPFYTVDLPYLWGQCRPDGRLVIGSGLVFAEPEELDGVNVESGDAGAMLARLEARVRGLHPALSQIHVECRWGGPIAIPVGRGPLLGRLPSADRVVVAGGYAGHGIALAVRCGEMAAAALAEDRALPEWGRL